MATTFGDLIEECTNYLHSFGAARDKLTSLSLGLNATDTTFTVADGRQIDRGFLEIDNELMAVNTIDVSTGIVTLHPFGRGARGTVAASHLTNAMITSSPRFPRNRVRSEILQVVNGLYPELFNVAVDQTNTANPAVVTYPLPADARSIVSVQYQTTGPSKLWAPITRYRIDQNADTTAFPTGRSVDIFAGMQPGRSIKIRYRREFPDFVNETDTFASIFLAEDWRDIIRLMVVGRLLMGLEPARLELDSVESAARSQTTGGVQPTAAVSVGKQYLALAQSRMVQERRRLLEQYPSTQVRMS